jgi:3-methyl-2-oxobutanoate hydroxymethyltransferase
VSEIVTANSPVPVIGCGAGPGCDGQILIVPDILGLTEGAGPKFAKSYAQLAQPITGAINQYSADVRDGKFPDAEHSYHMKAGELDQLKQLLKDKN